MRVDGFNKLSERMLLAVGDDDITRAVTCIGDQRMSRKEGSSQVGGGVGRDTRYLPRATGWSSLPLGSLA
jgi:hypothetical protein